jgi:hypothetical protein
VIGRGGAMDAAGILCVIYDCGELYQDFKAILEPDTDESKRRRWEQCKAAGFCSES